jgi:hypothetical protein
VPFRFTGDSQLLYSQYLDLATYKPLIADPGGSYDMQPVPAFDGMLPVPPADGRWDPPPSPRPAGSGVAATDPGGLPEKPPLDLLTGTTGTEGEEN